MWHPFKSLIDKIMQGLEESFAENDHMPRSQKLQPDVSDNPLLTPFEQNLLRVFEYHRKKGDARAIYVSIEIHPGGKHRYEDPLTGFAHKADAAIGYVGKNEHYDDFMKAERAIGHNVVMLLDPQAPDLQAQIPYWKPGWITFPDQYLSFPVIAVRDAHELTAHDTGCNGIVLRENALEKRYANQAARTMTEEYRPISSIAPAHIKDYDHAVESAQPVYRDLPDFRPAFVKGALGKPVLAPSHIRGILTNDIDGSQQPRAGL